MIKGRKRTKAEALNRQIAHQTAPVGQYLGIMPDTHTQLTIRDSVYDIVPLDALAAQLINTEAFLRLQRIRQLGFVYRIWPGATHTRYEHSIGVYHLALRALRSLTQRAEGGLQFSEDELQQSLPQIFLAAALLHDIGHYPYSHSIEELGAPIIPHEINSAAIIMSGEIAGALLAHDIDPGRVAALVAGNEKEHGAALVLRNLLSGALDIDKLDYLPRDARSCNVPYGGVDVARLLSSLRIEDSSGEMELVVDSKGISPLNSLTHARQEMFDNIYWHHTGRAFTAMLLRAVQEAVSSETLPPDDLITYTDETLLQALTEPNMPAASQELARRLQLRKPHKMALELSAQAGKIYQKVGALYWDAAKRCETEITLSQKLAAIVQKPLPEWAVLIDIPKPEKWEMNTKVLFQTPPVGMRRLMSWTEATGQTPDDLSRYETYQRRIRIIVMEDFREAAKLHMETILRSNFL